MSFSRAKLQRFNDVKSCSPSPADYNVSPGTTRIISAVPYAISIQSTNNRNSTPKQPKKPNTVLSKANTKDVFLEQQELEVLKRKVIELNNTDLFITDPMGQIDRMKQRISELEQMNLRLTAENAQFRAELLKTEHSNCEQVLKECQFITEISEKIEFESRYSELSKEVNELNKFVEEQSLWSQSTANQPEGKIKSVQDELLVKFKQYKHVAEETNKQLREELEEKNRQLQELMNILAKNSDAQSLISTLRDENAKLKDNCLNLRLQLDAKEDEIRVHAKSSSCNEDEMHHVLEQLLVLQEKEDSYYQYCEYYKAKAADSETELENVRIKYDNMQQKFGELELENSQLEKKNGEQKLLIRKLKKQLEECVLELQIYLDGLKKAAVLGHEKKRLAMYSELQKVPHNLATASSQIAFVVLNMLILSLKQRN